MWSGAFLIPATTAYLRVKAGRHFPTDVIAGYATGAIVGYLIPHLHKKERKNSNLSWSPILMGDYTGLSLSLPIGRNK